MNLNQHETPIRTSPTGGAAGALEVVVGCMFAGKTSHLIDRLQAAAERGMRVGAFKHQLDSRYNAVELATHDGRSFPAMAVSEAADVELESEQFDFIGIDEVQFFGPPIVAVCDRLLAAGKELIVVGIDFNVRGKPFEPFPALKARASQISVMQCECDICGRPARHSQRLTPVVNNNWVGGRESYSPRCQDCFEPYQGELEP